MLNKSNEREHSRSILLEFNRPSNIVEYCRISLKWPSQTNVAEYLSNKI